MSLIIRDYQSKDQLFLQNLVESAWPSDPDLQSHARFGLAKTTPTQSRTLVALNSQQPIGFATIYQNQLHYHPHDFRISVVVEKTYQKKGIGQRLHRQILHDLLPGLPKRLRCLTKSGNQPAKQFLKQLGYYQTMISYAPILPITAVNHHQLQQYQQRLEQAGYQFFTLANKPNNLNYKQQLTQLCLEAYSDTHTSRPPTATLEQWQSIFLGEDCLPEAFFIVERHQQPIAFSSLGSSDNTTALEARWDGVARSERALELPLRLALKAQEVVYAQNHGIQTLNWEIDSVDSIGMRLLELLPFIKGAETAIWFCDV
jgi:GNAT superfamily N-acetyltransferase